MKTYTEILLTSLFGGIVALVVGELIIRGYTKYYKLNIDCITNNYLLEMGLFTTGFVAVLLGELVQKYKERNTTEKMKDNESE